MRQACFLLQFSYLSETETVLERKAGYLTIIQASKWKWIAQDSEQIQLKPGQTRMRVDEIGSHESFLHEPRALIDYHGARAKREKTVNDSQE